MKILNYTTTVPIERSVADIQRKLSSAKAQAIMQEFDPLGIVSHISFRIATPHGMMTFRLPCHIEKVQAVLNRTKGIEKRFKTREHAARVAWRILKDWIEAQLAIIQTEMVTLTEVFLPYAQNENGVTVYDRFTQSDFLQLGHKE